MIDSNQYNSLFQQKCNHFITQLNHQGINLPVTSYPSPPQYYRSRIEFSLKYHEGHWHYVMFGDNKQLLYMKNCPVAIEPIHNRMPKLLHFLDQHPTFAHRIFQINWRANLNDEVLITLIYHKILDDDWLEGARLLEQRLNAWVMGRSRKKALAPSQMHLDSTLGLNTQRLTLRQNDICFSQPNVYTNTDMLNWATAQLDGAEGDLLELYCGNGNFTCALASCFDRVLATELVKSAIKLCEHNLATNGISNVQIARLSAEETAQALQKKRAFNRLAHVDIADYRFSWVLLDPPRQGLDDFSRQFAESFDSVLYISCNPDALLQDLSHWRKIFTPIHIAVFDQFPYTHHLEVGVILKRQPRV